METIQHILECAGISGRPGANFIVKLSAKNTDVNPVLQAIMIGSEGNKGFSFSTEGHIIEE